MKIKAGLCGALLLVTATAYGLGVQSRQVESPTPASSANAVTDTVTPQIGERIREYVADAGLNPDYGNGRLLVQWMTKVAQEPEYRSNLSALSGNQGPFANAMLSSEDRLKFLRLMSDMANGSQNDCRMMNAYGSDFGAIAKNVSPKGLRDLLEMMDLIVMRGGARANPDERYTVAELLDVDARLEAVELPESLPNGSKSDPCSFIAFALGAIDALPDSERQRATYEFFRAIGGGKLASGSVLDDPMAYLDDVFDERRLPASIRSHLPPDGSRRLPYLRLIVDGDWVNKTTPEDSAPFTDTFVNRRNNGVIAELITSTDKSGKPNSSDFTLSYRTVDLLSQTVKSRTSVTMLGVLKDDAAIAIANQPIVEGKRIDFPLPLPSDKGQTSRICEIGQAAPASTIFGSLTGDAVDLNCSEVTKSGLTIRVHYAWLTDYGIILTRTIDDEYGSTDVVIRNVTVVKP